MGQPTYQDLIHENQRLQDENRQLRQRVGELEAQLARLEARVGQLEGLLEKAMRAGKRQAAPFSKGEPKKDPQKPGRKSGKSYGPKAHRPLPEQKPDEIIDVPLPPECPNCGGDIHEDHVDQQFQVEIPRRPIIRRFDIHVGECEDCGQPVRPRHPLQTSNAVGVAASQLGPDVQALIALMKDKYGLSYGDIHGLLEEAFGISVSRGGAAQVVIRAAERAEPIYEDLQTIVRQSEAVYPDETGWKLGGVLHWLWVFVTNLATLYVIRPGRGQEVPAEVLGADYAGRMIHDGWRPYDAFKKAIHQQCLRHLLHRAEELLEQASWWTGRFLCAVREFLQDALELRDRRDAGTISEHGLAVARGRLEKRLERLLAWNLSNPANRRFQAHLAKHRDQILTFLYDPDIEATNWPAEQAIRPAVVNRKVFGGNRTRAGAHAQEVLASLFATCVQWKQDALSFLADLICTPASERISAAAPPPAPLAN